MLIVLVLFPNGLFGAMSVRENLLMGAYTRSDRTAINADFERVLELFPTPIEDSVDLG